MFTLQQASNKLHLELVRTISEGAMVHRAKQMGSGHPSKRLAIKLTHNSTLTARKVILNDKGYRLTNDTLAIYIKDLMGSSSAAKRWTLSETSGLERNEEA